MTEVYERLRLHLDKHPTGAPEAPEIIEILSALFTPGEAEVAVCSGFIPMPVESIAERAGVDVEDARCALESMADKGLVFAREKNGQWGYALLPVMPGIFEFPYMKGVRDETLTRLAALWDSYLARMARTVDSADVPLARVVPIQEEVENEPRVLTYEKVYELIENASVVGLSHCACRTAFANCEGPLEACMVFEETCTYLVDRGYARYITKDEMKRLLRDFDRAGLVHNVNNSADKLQFICNCCPCCCGFLRGVKELKVPNFLATSGFLARVEDDLCTGCAICEERCPMDAIEIVDDLPVIDLDRCIGCALCVTGCDTEAMELARREEVPGVPASMRELGVGMLQRRGKLEEFLEVNR
ncbi:MAG: 4Fe-4S binding protein [Actinobacteria bacterium]|nr:4Fe-4S binding protein [Actinomycetota bacterium]MBU1944816.1 4Fe-4S binding protein [Actinomycetota bacterium]MBU2687117.1 4Fe-4S binding protein [Actinomycetota bacterium]